MRETESLLNELSYDPEERDPEKIDRLIDLLASSNDNELKKLYRTRILAEADKPITKFTTLSDSDVGNYQNDVMEFMPKKYTKEEGIGAVAAFMHDYEVNKSLAEIPDHPISSCVSIDEQCKIQDILQKNEH